MQRLASFSFLAVVLVLLAFTVHETKKPDLTARASSIVGKRVTETCSASLQKD